jgi:hypothetical protein
MPISFKIGVGAAITFTGIAAFVYTKPIVASMLSTKGPVFKESDVPQHPARLMSYIPIEIAGVGALIVGISFMAVGLVESLPSPTIHNDATKEKENLAESHIDKSNATGAA